MAIRCIGTRIVLCLKVIKSIYPTIRLIKRPTDYALSPTIMRPTIMCPADYEPCRLCVLRFSARSILYVRRILVDYVDFRTIIDLSVARQVVNQICYYLAIDLFYS